MEANETTETIAVGKKNSPLEVSSRIISGIFTPFMIPFVAFFLLFFFTYLRIMPIQYKLIVLGIVYCFTILMPMLAIYLFQKINGWGIHELGHREKRFVPYALTIISYVTCLITMYKIHLPRYFKWKISTHVASSGMMVGGLLSYSFIFNFNPVWWLCFFILLSGMLGTARIIVKQHTLLEVLAGFIVGLFCGVIGILFI